MSLTGEQQYLALGQRIIDEGVPIYNERTGITCHTVINADFEYDCSGDNVPLMTTRKSFFRSATAEMLGYLRGLSDAQEFADLGSPTWFVNANKTKAWLANPNRKGENDCGRIYGVQGRRWQRPDGTTFDQLAKVVNNLSQGIDDRGEIVTFFNPGETELGCLRACMHTHTFSILGDTLHMTSYQRSVDYFLGLAANTAQTWFLLKIMARITGLKPGKVFHKMVNIHIYDNQLELGKEQLARSPFPEPKMFITDKLKTLEDLETWFDPKNPEHLWVEDYEHHPAIKYPFAE